MPLLKTVEPAEAEGAVKEAYDFFLKMGPQVPAPVRLMSVSPEILKIQGQNINYFMSHPSLSFTLLAHIRLLVAHQTGYDFCVNMNSGLLTMLGGLSDQQVEAAMDDPEKASLEDKDKAMLLFVLQAVKDPDSVDQGQVDRLHDLGWTDKDIFDATVQGTNMTAANILFRAFKMDQC